MSSRRAVLRHFWSMVQTRAEAASLVVQLQRTAVTQGLLFFGIAAVTALSFMTAVIVWIAVAAPPAWRAWALGGVALALLAATVFCVLTAGKKLRGDANLIADFKQGLKLDLAMLKLAMKDPNTEDEAKIAERENAKEKVREAAAEKAETPSTAEGGRSPSPGGPAEESAAAAMRAANSPRPDVAAAGTPGAAGTAATASPETSGRPAHARTAAGYAFTGGGTYASTAASPDPIVEDHAMPEALGRPNESGEIRSGDLDRKQGHGST